MNNSSYKLTWSIDAHILNKFCKISKKHNLESEAIGELMPSFYSQLASFGNEVRFKFYLSKEEEENAGKRMAQ